MKLASICSGLSVQVILADSRCIAPNSCGGRTLTNLPGMNRPGSSRFRASRLLALLLGVLLMFTAGCAAFSRAKIGISGTNDSERPLGR